MTDGHATALAALRRWDVPDTLQLERPGTGTMNEIFIVGDPDPVFVLRGHRRRDAALVSFEHEVMQRAITGGVPAPLAVETSNGDRFVQEAGRLWSLLQWLPGEQVPRDEVTVAHTSAMGTMLAHVHRVLEDVAAERSREHVREPESSLVARIDRLVAHLGTRDHGDDERAALQWLRAQRDWVVGEDDAPLPERTNSQLIHGDYHDANVLFDGSTVVGVIDWDKADEGSTAEEAIRAMHLSFGLDRERCAAFLAGYRKARALTDDDLEIAARRYGHQRDRSIWLFEELYLQGNERLRPLVNHRPFAPFEQSWRALRL